MFIAFKLIFKHMNILVLFVFKQKLFVHYFFLFFLPLHTSSYVGFICILGSIRFLLIKQKWNARNKKAKRKKKKIKKNGKRLWLFLIAKILIRIGWFIARSQIFYFDATKKYYMIASLFAILRFNFAPFPPPPSFFFFFLFHFFFLMSE